MMADGSLVPRAGVSTSRKKTIAASCKLWDLYRNSSPELRAKYPDPWDKCTLEVATNFDSYAGVAKYMICDHTYNGSETLSADTINLYLGALLTLAKNRFNYVKGVSGETVTFFLCNIPNSGTHTATAWNTIKGESNVKVNLVVPLHAYSPPL